MSFFKNKELKYSLIKLAGYIIVLVGVFGLFLPFLQGFLFLAIGLYLISLASPALKEKLMIHFKKNTGFHNVLDKIDEFIRNFIEKL